MNKIYFLGIPIVIILGLYFWGNFGDKQAQNFNGDNSPTSTSFYEKDNDKDCTDFSSQKEAQKFFVDEGGPQSDYHGLDRDKDGIACESLK